jgi:hypothetical protein
MHVQHLNDQPADPAMLHALAPHGSRGLYRGPTRRMHALGVSSLTVPKSRGQITGNPSSKQGSIGAEGKSGMFAGEPCRRAEQVAGESPAILTRADEVIE